MGNVCNCTAVIYKGYLWRYKADRDEQKVIGVVRCGGKIAWRMTDWGQGNEEEGQGNDREALSTDSANFLRVYCVYGVSTNPDAELSYARRKISV